MDGMAYDDLRSLLRALEREGDLKRVTTEVDPYLEVGEIVDRVNKAGGPALLFEKVKGSSMPLAMNVYGTDRRLLKALGLTSYSDIGEKIAGLLRPELPQGFVGVREAFGKLGAMAHVPPKKVKEARVQETVHLVTTSIWTRTLCWGTAGPSSIWPPHRPSSQVEPV